MERTTETLSITNTQLAAARACLKKTGKTPLQLGLESRKRALAWIYRWGYSSSTLIQLLLGRTAGGYAQKLVRQGWLNFTKTESGSPVGFYTLTEQGLQEAERFASELYRYPEIDNYKVNQQQIRHYLLAQNATLTGLHTGGITYYETERMFDQAGDKAGVKRPDIIWYTTNGVKIGVEIELSAKWNRDLDDFVVGIVRALQSSGNKPAKFDRFAIFANSPAIIDRYRNAMQPGSDLNLWQKNQRGRWNIEKTVKVPSWLIDKVDFQLIEG